MLPFGMEAEHAESAERAEPVGSAPSGPTEGTRSRQDLQGGLIGAGLACPMQRGNCVVPLAEPVPVRGLAVRRA